MLARLTTLTLHDFMMYTTFVDQVSTQSHTITQTIKNKSRFLGV